MQPGERFARMQEVLEGLFRAGPFGVIVFDRAGTILEINAQQEANSGVRREQVVGRSVLEVFGDVIARYGLHDGYRRLVGEGRAFRAQLERYEPQFLDKKLRLWLWGFPLVPGELFGVLTEGVDVERLRASPDIVGASAQMEAVYRFIEQAARVSTTVLLGGESGTGKELVAHAIHGRSDRARKPFLALNCAALPGPLLESTLFGSEKGAFTGADRRTKGFFEAAQGGVLLLDEIGETSLEFQVKLLRVLQDGVITRVGGTDAVRTDVRVICATNRDLEAEVAARRFREDLFYRINILRILLPPLRERPGDIPLLAKHFLEELDGKHHLGRKHLTPEVLDAFLGYRWPGNVRELANVLEGIYVTVPDQAIRLDHLPNRVREGAILHPAGHLQPHAYHDALRWFRREYFKQVLACAGDDVQKAAKLACVNPSTVYRLGRPRAEGRAAVTPQELQNALNTR
jgi:transcriptional regulator with PAS, ATPase and Fis domain